MFVGRPLSHTHAAIVLFPTFLFFRCLVFYGLVRPSEHPFDGCGHNRIFLKARNKEEEMCVSGVITGGWK